MQKSARLRVSEPRTDVRSRISAYRLVAYSSVVYCLLSVLSVCVTLPMLARFVHQLKHTMHNELAFCKASAADIRSEVRRLKGAFDSAHNRTAPHATYITETGARDRRGASKVRRDSHNRSDTTRELEEMDHDAFEVDPGDVSKRKNATQRKSARRPKSKTILKKMDENLFDGVPGVKITLEKSSGIKGAKKDQRKGKAVARYESEIRCAACCLPGKAGAAGTPGRPGKIGNRGAPGLPGNPGRPHQLPCAPITPPPCKPCPRGAPGPRGPPGEPGDPGAPGLAGRSGRNGEQGAHGPKGARGPPGKDGSQGPPGEPGTAARSEQPVRGDPGPAGVPGPQGPPGRDGEPGANGQHGEPGQKGPRGPDGAPGADGSPGSIGTPGRLGTRGEAGICPRYCAHDGGVFFDDATKHH